MQNDLNDSRSIGFYVLGPLLFGFARRIKKFADENKPEKIIFLSRDGLIIKKAFDLMYKDEYHTVYAYASRRALTVPILWMKSDLKEVERLIHFHRNISVNKIFEKLGLRISDYKKALEKNGLKEDSVIKEANISDDSRITNLYRTIRKDIEKNSKDEYYWAKKYWKEVVGNSKNCFVVDIGWSGSLQNAISSLIETQKYRVVLKGLYLGTIPYDMYSNDMDGYLCDHKNSSEVFSELKDYMSIVEFLFDNDQPSVKKYGSNGVIFYDPEYTNDESMLINESVVLSEIHDEALRFIAELLNSGEQLSDDECKKSLFSLGKNPSLKAAEMLGDCRTYDYEMAYIARPAKGRFNISEYQNVSWKAGYMRRCFRRDWTIGLMNQIITLLKRLLGE